MAATTVTYDCRLNSGGNTFNAAAARGKKIITGTINCSSGMSLTLSLQHVDCVMIPQSSNYLFSYDTSTTKIYAWSASTGNVMTSASAAVFTALPFIALGD